MSENETGLVKFESRPLEETLKVAELLAKSGFFVDAREMAQAAAKILAGAELGFPPLISMMNISIIKGKVSLGANLQASAIKKSGKYNYKVLTLDNTLCKLEFFEGSRSIGTSRFDLEDAKKAEVGNLGKFPRNMLFARAISNGAKWYTPDVFGGQTVYAEGELSDVEAPTPCDTATGEVIEGEAVESPQQPQEPRQAASAPKETQPPPSTEPLTPQQVRKVAGAVGFSEQGLNALIYRKFKVIHLTGLASAKVTRIAQLVRDSTHEFIEQCEAYAVDMFPPKCTANGQDCPNCEGSEEPICTAEGSYQGMNCPYVTPAG